jgi:hypothetical protein
MKRLILAAAAALSLGACATETPFQPASKSNWGQGYSDQRLENDRWRVVFTGNYVTSRQVVESYMLFRAAQVTLEHGYDWFETVKNATGAQVTYLGDVDDGWWEPYGPYWQPTWTYYDGWGNPWGDTPGFQAQTDIIVHHGRKPEKEAHAFDAREVIANVGPHVLLPKRDS